MHEYVLIYIQTYAKNHFLYTSSHFAKVAFSSYIVFMFGLKLCVYI